METQIQRLQKQTEMSDQTEGFSDRKIDVVVVDGVVVAAITTKTNKNCISAKRLYFLSMLS